MNILYYHQHFSTYDGATGTRSYAFAKALLSKGHNVTMICGSNWVSNTGLKNEFTNGKREGEVEGINIIEFQLSYSNSDNFFKRSITFFKYAFRGARIFFKKDFDIVFASSTPLTAGIPGIVFKILKKKTFIFEIRDLWPQLPKEMGVIKNPVLLKAMDLLETISYKYADACIGLSPGIVSGIKKKCPNKRVDLIPNGCDISIVNNIKEFNNTNKFIAAFTGAHGYANGLDAVLDVAKFLLEKNEMDIEFHFIGDGVLKPKLLKRAEIEGLENCKFIDPIPKIELFQYLLTNVHVGLMILKNVPAFYYGTSPNKFFDYISLGLPVINNYPGWLADIILQHKCGIPVKPNNIIDFTNALLKLKENISLRKKMGGNSFSLAKEKFDRKILSNRFVKFIESFEKNDEL